MTEDRAIADAAEIVAFAEAACKITTLALNALGDTVPEGLRQPGAQLYLMVQMVPKFGVLLMLDVAPGAADNQPVELARWTGEEAEAIRRQMMN
ncbi:MAG: hypothetical protein Q8M19_06910 [Reyranella sp.]|nr:hypothetical protein [Reyranella sp.]